MVKIRGSSTSHEVMGVGARQLGFGYYIIHSRSSLARNCIEPDADARLGIESRPRRKISPRLLVWEV